MTDEEDLPEYDMSEVMDRITDSEDIEAMMERNDGMYLDMEGELGDYEWLQDTGHWDRRLHNSRIRVSNVLYALSANTDFEQLRYWEVETKEIEDVIRYYRDNRIAFREMDDDIYDVDSLNEGVERWEEDGQLLYFGS
jgi:hypothetical protein